jgi:mRNA interferase MazF
VKRRGYVPARGDLVWLQFSPQAGHEQGGHRPALVLSPQEYNQSSGLALLCPITSRIKGYPFEVPLPAGLKIQGAVLSDHIRTVDWVARGIQRIGPVPADVVRTVLAKAATLLI